MVQAFGHTVAPPQKKAIANSCPPFKKVERPPNSLIPPEEFSDNTEEGESINCKVRPLGFMMMLGAVKYSFQLIIFALQFFNPH